MVGAVAWSEFAQYVFAGLSLGSVYALVALGFVLLYRATSIVNFAQGDFSMVAAFMLATMLNTWRWPYGLAILGAVGGAALFGGAFARIVYYPLRNRSFMPVIIATIGASIATENMAQYIWGAQPLRVNSLLAWPGLRAGGVYLDSQYLIAIAGTVAAVVALYLLFERTRLGKQLQAVSQDKEMASLLGLPVGRLIVITFMLSAAVAAVAGVLIAPILFVSIGMASNVALKAFAASIIGGFGHVVGAIVGGLLLGLVDSLGAGYISVPFQDAFGLGLVVLFLLVRPQGLFGERVGVKA